MLDYLPACDLPGQGSATSALRMQAFVGAFGDSGATYSLCAGDLRAPMQKIGERIRLLVGNLR